MTMRNFEQETGFEKEPTAQLIEDVLPRYYETHGERTRYEVERSIMIDQHEVAWLRYEGKNSQGESYTGHELQCTCHFTENVGWKMHKGGFPAGLIRADKCLKKEAALYLRHLEIREEYKERDMFGKWGHPNEEELEAIMLDLIEKAKADEFLEGTTGAQSWGGYYYLQTVASIADVPMASIWKTTDKLIDDKQIQLEGNVVQPYTEPNPPSWEAHTSLQSGDLRIEAALPTHSKMPQTWQFEVYKKVGDTEEKIEIELPQEPLEHPILFGVDIDDTAHAKECMAKILEALQSEYDPKHNT